MKKVFLLWHTREDDEYQDNSKLLGVFSSEPLAQEKIKNHYSKQPGFKNHLKGFEISEYEVDKMQWAEGFGFDD